MDDGQFDMFKDGKTDDIFKTQAEIDADKLKLEEDKSTFEKDKDRLIKDAASKLNKDGDEKLIPPTEIGDDDGDDKTKDEPEFPKTDDVIKLYKLESSRLSQLKPGLLKRADQYMADSYAKED